MWLFSDFIAKKPAHYTLLWLTIITTILFLPIIGLYYGIPQALGLSAKTVAIIEIPNGISIGDRIGLSIEQ